MSSTGERPRRRVRQSINQPRDYFVPIHPFSSIDGPYTKPGYFLIPGHVNPKKMSINQWLNMGRLTHWIVLSIGVLTVFVLMFAVTMIQTPWKQQTTNQPINQSTQIRRSAGDDDLLEIHMRLRDLINLQPINESIDAPYIEHLSDTSINQSPIEFVWQRSDDHIHQSIYNQSDLHSILHGIDDHDDQSRYQSINQGWVLLFHGCSHRSIDWFVLPEEQMVVRYFLSLGLSVFAVSSVDQLTGCWDGTFSPSSDDSSINQSPVNVDAVRVLTAFKHFAAREFDTVHRHDLFVYGGSSGGSFASIISRALPVRAQIIQISPGVEAAFMTASTRSTKAPANQPIHQSVDPYALQSTSTLYPVPPTAFVYMSRDSHWASAARVNGIAKKLKDSGRRVGPRLQRSDSITTYQVTPLAISKEFLYERIGDISLEHSEAFFRALHRDSFIDRYGFLSEDPRHSHLVGYLIDLHSQESGDTAFRTMLLNKRAAIEEEMNVAWAEHELTSAYCDQITWWMLAQAK